MIKKRYFLILVTFWLVIAATTPIQNQFQQDLDFMMATINENHPGPCNKRDPHFSKRWKRAYSKAHKALETRKTDTECKKILEKFTQSFDDVHLRIEWNNVAQKATQERNNKQFTLEIKNIANRSVIWVTLPTFYNLTNQQTKDLETITQKLSSLTTYDAFVFDIRGNGGGNSKYGNAIIDQLFGTEYAEQQRNIALQKQFIDWRVSPDNITHLRELYHRFKIDDFMPVIDGMTKALNNNKQYYRSKNRLDGLFKTNFTNRLAGKPIIILINGANKSAALDFIDQFFIIKHEPLILIGESTSYDRLYMEVRIVELPSKTGSFVFPIKVFRNRLRKDKERYNPNIKCTTNNEEEIQKIIQGFISKNSSQQSSTNTVIINSMRQQFEVTYLTNTRFPQIHIKPTHTHNGFLHLVRTDAKEPNLQCFIDAADPIKYPDIYPFYTLNHDFYDAPEWYYTADYKPLTFWKGHAWCIKIDKEAKTIRCCGGISWGFKFTSKTLHPKALPLKPLTQKDWKHDWRLFKNKFPAYQTQF